ncbi:MAG TPA: cell division protein ZapA [Burkholderiaceae bacterium]|jgi:cell division protein ZapA|nr:cell division protein ZapA [Burkholderiaceae bacterium]
MKQIDAQIMGQGYRLAAPEGGEAQLLAAVARLDVAMCRIRDAGKVKARDRIAVLAALNLAFDLEQAERAAAQATPVAPRADASPATPRADEARLAQLAARLDRVLGDDGYLI